MVWARDFGSACWGRSACAATTPKGQCPQPGSGRYSGVLGATRAGQVVSFDELAELIWDGAPPACARCNSLRGYVKRLRQILGPGLAGRVVTREPGYLLEVAAGELDLLLFNRPCADGGAAARAGRGRRPNNCLMTR